MKILMVTMGLDIGGAETHIVELVKELKHQGHDVAVISNGGVYVPEIEAAGIRHYQAPLHRRALGDMRAARTILRRVIRQEKPDVVHAHARIPAFLCGTLQKSMGFPFVTTAHWVFDASGVLRYLTNWGQRTVAVSDDIREYLIREYKLPAEQISVTINGIDTEKFSPAVSGDRVAAEFGLDTSKPILSYVSRMDEDRALAARQLIEIAPELDKAVPGIQLLIAGGGNVFDELKAQADGVNAALDRQCVVMTGPRTDINEIVAAGQVFVGVSRAALEAMAAAKPVVVAGNEGFLGLFGPEKLETAREGNFCCRGLPLSTPELLLESVREAFALSREEQDRLGGYGRQVIGDYYSVRRMAEDCLAVYRQVRKQRSVVLSGYYGFHNLGDDAILDAIARHIRSMDDALRLTVLSNAPQEAAAEYGVEAVHRFSPLAVYRAIRRCDYFVSGGGSLLQDKTSAQSLLYYTSLIRAAQLHRKPVMIFANGIGPVDRPLGRKLVRRVLERADLITLREESSLAELRSMGVKNQNIRVTADPVFLIEGVDETSARSLLAQAGVPAGAAPLVGVSLRSVPGRETAIPALAEFCDKIAARSGAALVFLDMQEPQDGEYSRKVEALMHAPVYHFATRSTQEMMGVIRCMDAVVSMRLHTLIFSAKQRVPLLGIVYDPKVSAYLETLGMPSAGSIDDFDPDGAAQAFAGLMADLPDRRKHLEEIVPALEEAAGENWSVFSQLLERK